MFPNVVILPDGTPFVVGGISTFAPGDPCPCTFVYQAEFLRNGVWTKTGPMLSRRGYHAGALLHPSGRVIVGGGNDRDWDYEVYEPWYFYTGTRPTILSAPAAMSYGQTYTIGYHLPSSSEFVQKVVLTRPGAVTHHSCSEQRWIALEQPTDELPIPGYVNCKAPPNSRYAQRGWWLLWLVTNFGTPSVAAWIELKN
jgi:hypothetical protein